MSSVPAPLSGGFFCPVLRGDPPLPPSEADSAQGSTASCPPPLVSTMGPWAEEGELSVFACVHVASCAWAVDSCAASDLARATRSAIACSQEGGSGPSHTCSAVPQGVWTTWTHLKLSGRLLGTTSIGSRSAGGRCENWVVDVLLSVSTSAPAAACVLLRSCVSLFTSVYLCRLLAGRPRERASIG